ncbi:phage minor head protein [Halostella sp. PRR32]|uniref:phage head morphogenesis protein n=1 Tax=Halostella sp. PRR32 TaxID=3098147 RepID=UPI002B1DD596|nr:phage minor head protein [Halostella sp. PRR32]
MIAGQRRADPTRTKTARRRFAQHLRSRWNAIKYHVNRGIVDNDALGLRGPDVGGTLEAQSGDLDREFEAHVDTNDDLTPGAGQFDFPRDADKAEAFEDWLNEATDDEILEDYNGDRFVRKGYGQGVKHADSQLQDIDVDAPDQDIATTLQLPVHEDKLELLYTRTFEELEGVTDAASQEIRRELTEGLSQGKHPRDIARNINDRVEKVGKTRSTVLARTEVIRAHSEGSLDRYGSIAGDLDLTVKAELQTAGDSRVCERCAALEGRVYTVQEARGIIPVHPQCRCSWMPAPGSS